jgi:hypothetical protein
VAPWRPRSAGRQVAREGRCPDAPAEPLRRPGRLRDAGDGGRSGRRHGD